MERMISGAARISGALLLTNIFIVMLMTAVAQQSVLSRMNREDLQVGYGVAYAMLRNIETRQNGIGQLLRSEGGLISQSDKLDGELRQRQEEADTSV